MSSRGTGAQPVQKCLFPLRRMSLMLHTPFEQKGSGLWEQNVLERLMREKRARRWEIARGFIQSGISHVDLSLEKPSRLHLDGILEMKIRHPMAGRHAQRSSPSR